MSNAFDTKGPSLLASTKEGRRAFKTKQKFFKNMPPLVLNGSSKNPPPKMMTKEKDGSK